MEHPIGPVSADPLKPFDPRAHDDLIGPGTAVLLYQMAVGAGNRLGPEHGPRLVIRFGAARVQYATVDVDPSDMDPLGVQFACHAFGQAALGELAMAKGADCGKPLTPADAPVNKMVPFFPSMASASSIRFAACLPVRQAPMAVTSIARRTSSTDRSVIGPRTRADGL